MNAKNVTSRLALVLSVVSLSLMACSKKDEKKESEKKPQATKPEVKKPEVKKPEVKKPEVKKPEAKADLTADYVRVVAMHEPAKPADPVRIAIEKFSVKSATFDPANLEGATAEIELDLSSIKSDSDKRDAHLKNADYLDVGKFATANVKIADVKKKDDKTFTASAEVTAHGMTKKLPVTFTVVESKPDSVRVQAKHEFDRTNFGIGKEPDGNTEHTSKKVSIEMQLTLKKS